MKYSKLFGQTTKNTPKDEKSRNAQLLIKAGFIQKEMAGVYAFLPLGILSLQKTISIIRDEMNKIGGQEILLGSLQNKETWEASGRWDDEVVDVWFKTKLKNDTEVGLAATHEEPLTKLMQKHVRSYKDLPLYSYQFQTKFRNELRARSGLLRTREFIMKDLYSFNKTQKDLDEFYEQAKVAYLNIFKRSSLENETFITFASGGMFCKYSHEFQTVCKNGEDTIYLDRNKKLAVNKEVYNDEVLSDLKIKKTDIEEVSAIEVGNIFQLGTKFSKAFNLNYKDEKGKDQYVVMGSYGVGPARLLATIVELHNDKNGIIWPITVAPYQVHIVSLEGKDVNKKAERLYSSLTKEGIEVLWDERVDASAGEKFADADLIGIPIRLVVSKRSLEKNGIEFRQRNNNDTKIIRPNIVVEYINETIKSLQESL